MRVVARCPLVMQRGDRPRALGDRTLSDSASVQIFYTCMQCQRGVSAPLDPTTRELTCDSCGAAVVIPREAVTPARIQRCVVCPSEELYVRKDFPQQLGVAIVAFGVVLSTIAWYYRQVYLTYGIFFATAAIDFVLWLVMGNMLQCYRCRAQYRGVEEVDRHGTFDLETHEKHRQQLIRLAQAQAAQAEAGQESAAAKQLPS
jgi:DNA-directed RNA polymerase subunit RPC12/RpoP